MPGKRLAQRFALHRQLKTGAGIDTWAGHDQLEDRAVILKVADLASMPPGTQQRLEQEARVLEELSCPHVVPLLSVGRHGRQLVLAMPEISGQTLRDCLDEGPLAVLDTLSLGRALAAGLEAVHAHGILHRDLKPTNVVVPTEGGLEATVLIDFGLARTLQASVEDAPAGTAAYMAPEQAGLVSHPVGPGSDLYALGAVLFECLAGRPPFTGDSVRAVLHQHASASPPDLRALRPEVPRCVEKLLGRLLEKDPGRRYQSAAGVGYDLERIGQALERDPDPELALGVQDQRDSLAEPAFLGRAGELEALREAYREVARDTGSVVLLSASSGGGKSRLLEEFARDVRARGGWVLRGQARARSAHSPFALLEGVAAEVQRAAAEDPELRSRLARALDSFKEALCPVLPQLNGLFEGVDLLEAGVEEHAQERTRLALQGLMDALGSPERPAVLLLDDCQWSDRLSLSVLESWSPRGGTLVVAAYRPEELPPDSPLRRLRELPRIEPAPFDRETTGQVLESMAGPLPPEVPEEILRLSEGSPFVVEALLRGLVEGGQLVFEGGRWSLGKGALEEVQSSRRATVMLMRRLELLPEDTRRLLQVAALVGKAFPLDLVAYLGGQEREAAGALLEVARERHLVLKDGREFAFMHDRIREALLAQLEPAEKRRLHREAAERLTSSGDQDPYRLAHHLVRRARWRRLCPTP